MPLSVVTWLWHDPDGRWNKFHRYTPDQVRRLAAMVRANLKLPHEFVVVTDQTEADFGADIRVVPLWPEARELGGCWTRLKAFDRQTGLLLGERFVSIDLDCVVTGDLTPLLDRPDDFVICRGSVGRNPYNGSMWLMTAGARQAVWSTFDPIGAAGRMHEAKLVGTDQAWMAHVLGPDEAIWQKRDGVMVFRQDCNRGLPERARIVFFPGRPKPTDRVTRMANPWIEQRQTAALRIEEPVYNDARSLAKLPRNMRALAHRIASLERRQVERPEIRWTDPVLSKLNSALQAKIDASRARGRRVRAAEPSADLDEMEEEPDQ